MPFEFTDRSFGGGNDGLDWDYDPSPLEGQLEQFVQQRMRRTPEFEHDLTLGTPAIQDDLMEQVRATLAGEDVGLDPQQRQVMLEQAQRPLAAERRQAQRRAEVDTARRGLEDSAIADQLVADIERGFAEQLADVEAQMLLQDLQQRTQEEQAAQQLGTQLAQMEQQQRAGDLDRMLQQWAQEQQMAWQPFEGAMQHLTGVHMPQQQMEQQQALQEWQMEQQQPGPWETIGQIAPYLFLLN